MPKQDTAGRLWRALRDYAAEWATAEAFRLVVGVTIGAVLVGYVSAWGGDVIALAAGLIFFGTVLVVEAAKLALPMRPNLRIGDTVKQDDLRLESHPRGDRPVVLSLPVLFDNVKIQTDSRVDVSGSLTGPGGSYDLEMDCLLWGKADDGVVYQMPLGVKGGEAGVLRLFVFVGYDDHRNLYFAPPGVPNTIQVDLRFSDLRTGSSWRVTKTCKTV